MVNRVEADPKSAHFGWIILFDASSCSLNALPVLLSKGCIIECVESWTYQNNEVL